LADFVHHLDFRAGLAGHPEVGQYAPAVLVACMRRVLRIFALGVLRLRRLQNAKVRVVPILYHHSWKSFTEIIDFLSLFYSIPITETLREALRRDNSVIDSSKILRRMLSLSPLSIFLLGAPKIESGGRAVDFDTRKAIA